MFAPASLILMRPGGTGEEYSITLMILPPPVQNVCRTLQIVGKRTFEGRSYGGTRDAERRIALGNIDIRDPIAESVSDGMCSCRADAKVATAIRIKLDLGGFIGKFPRRVSVVAVNARASPDCVVKGP